MYQAQHQLAGYLIMTLPKRALIVLIVFSLFLISACQPSDTADTSPPESQDKQTMQMADTPPETMATDEPMMASEPCELVMGWDPWEPYHYEDSDGETRGMDVDFAVAMAAGANCTVRFVRGEWARLIKDLRDGRIDMLAGATMVEQREAFATFSDSYRTESFTLHVGSDAEIAGNDLFSLLDAGFRLGLTEGYIYGPAISTIQDNPIMAQRIVYSPIAEYHFDNLVEGKIDGFLEDPYVAEAIARRHGWESQVRALPINFGTHDVRFMFSSENLDEGLIAKLNETLAAMKNDGTSKEIMSRYLN